MELHGGIAIAMDGLEFPGQERMTWSMPTVEGEHALVQGKPQSVLADDQGFSKFEQQLSGELFVLGCARCDEGQRSRVFRLEPLPGESHGLTDEGAGRCGKETGLGAEGKNQGCPIVLGELSDIVGREGRGNPAAG